MKFRHKIISMASVAAVLAMIAAVTALAAGGLELGKPREDAVADRPTALSTLAPRQTALPTLIPEQTYLMAEPTPAPLPADPVMVYFTEEGDHYHTISTCGGMTGAVTQTNVKSAKEQGKSACPLCIGADASEPNEEGLYSAFYELLGVEFDSAFPGYALRSATGSADKGCGTWSFGKGEQLVEAELEENASLRLSFLADDENAADMLRGANETISTLYTQTAPSLLKEAKLADGSARLIELVISFDDLGLHSAELTYSLDDGSTATLTYSLDDGSTARLTAFRWET